MSLRKEPSLSSWWSGPLWLGLISCLAGVLLLSSQPLEDHDTYLHITTGYWIFAHQALPVADPYSHTMAGQPWVPHEWLAQCLMAGLHHYLGWTGLVLMAVVCFSLPLVWGLRFLLERVPPIYALLFTAMTAATIGTHMLARPHVLSWPLLVLWAGALVQASEQRRAPDWWLLPVMVLWANLHGSFTLGLALVGALGVDAVLQQRAGERRATAWRWAVFALLAAGAAMITPYGWKGLWFTLHVTQLKYLNTINEWRPATHWLQLMSLELWVVVLLGLAASGLMRLPPWRLLLLIGLLHQAMTAGRYISVLGLLAPLLVATPFGQSYRSQLTASSQASGLDRFFERFRARAGAGLRLAAALLVVLATWFMTGTKQHGPDTSNQPIAAIEAARAAGLQGPVLNASHFGGFLIFHGIPVFIDGRADVYGDRLMGEYFDHVVHGEAGDMQRLLDKYRITWTLLPPDSHLLLYLSQHPEWRKVYADRIAVVYAREPR
jgi:hypothetical protein